MKSINIRYQAMATVLGLSIAVSGPIPALLAQGLVVGGERIADEALFQAAKKEGRLTIYGVFSSRNHKTLETAFQKDTGIKIDYVNLTAQRLYPRVTSEFNAGKLAADFVNISDPTLVHELVTKGIFNQPYKAPNFDLLPPEVRDSQGRWYAVLRNVQAIGVNAALVREDDQPKSWKDLLDPKWSGSLGINSIQAGGSAFIAQAFLRNRIDRQFWTKLADRKPRIYPSVSPLATDLARGEIKVGVASPSTFLLQIRAGAPLKVVFPDEGVASFPVAGGVTASAPHPNAARLFIAWITSVRGGAVISTEGVYASHPKAPVPALGGLKFPPVEKVWSLEIDRWTEVRDAYTDEWRKAFRVQ